MGFIMLIIGAVLTLHWKLDHETYVSCEEQGRGCRFQSTIAEHLFDCMQ